MVTRARVTTHGGHEGRRRQRTVVTRAGVTTIDHVATNDPLSGTMPTTVMCTAPLRLVGGGAAARDAADTSARRAAMQQVLLGFPLTLCMEWMHTEVRSNLSNGLCIESLSRLGSLRFENL